MGELPCRMLSREELHSVLGYQRGQAAHDRWLHREWKHAEICEKLVPCVGKDRDALLRTRAKLE